MRTEILLEDWYYIIQEYSLIFIILGIIVILSGWFTIISDVKIYIKMVIIPVFLSLFCVIIFYANDILGYAYPSWPNGQVIYMGSKWQNDTIDLWVRHVGDKYTRLYRIPYSKKIIKIFKKLDMKRKITGKQFVLEWDNYHNHDIMVPSVINLIDLDYYNKENA